MAIQVKNSKSKSGLGSAPKREEPNITNLSKFPSDVLVSLSFKVPIEFRREYKQYALDKDKSMSDILKESFKAFRKNNL